VLASVLGNLVRNAVKYGEPDDCRIEVRASVRDNDTMRIEVVDSGPGIPADMLDTIFLPYVRGPTAGRQGLGLGLATVKRLVDAHGGSVSVHSEIGCGSTFAFELPLAVLPSPR